MKTHNRVLLSLFWLENICTLLLVIGVVAITLLGYPVTDWGFVLMNFGAIVFTALYSRSVQRDLAVVDKSTTDSLVLYYRKRLGGGIVTTAALAVSGTLWMIFMGKPWLLLALYPAAINLIYARHFAQMRTSTE